MEIVKGRSKYPEEYFERVVIPRIESGVGMYSREILSRGMSVGVSINLDDIEVEYDRFGNVADVLVPDIEPIEETLDDWHPVYHDYGGEDLRSQADRLRNQNKLKAVVRSLPEVQVVLVNRLEGEGGPYEKRVVLAISNQSEYGTVTGAHGRALMGFIEQLAAEGKVLEVTAGHVIADHDGIYHDGREIKVSQVEGRLQIPLPDRLIKWYHADETSRIPMDLTKPATAVSPIRDAGKYRTNIESVLAGSRNWHGIATVEAETMTRGKYVGDIKLHFFIDGLQVGSTHPQYRKLEPEVFDYIESGAKSIPVRSSFSYSEDSELRFEAVLDLDEN